MAQTHTSLHPTLHRGNDDRDSPHGTRLTPRILVINPNASETCSAGISTALDPFRRPGGPVIDVATLREGPPAIYSWCDWHAVVGPLCDMIGREVADVYVIACASDPGIEAARAVTSRPVLGIFRAAVATAVALAERFGIIALVDSSLARHQAALRAMGLADRLAGEVPLNVSMETLLEPRSAAARLIAAGETLKAMGAETLILGCTGMAHHRAAVQAAVGLPTIDPTQAAGALAIGMALAEAPAADWA